MIWQLLRDALLKVLDNFPETANGTTTEISNTFVPGWPDRLQGRKSNLYFAMYTNCFKIYVPSTIDVNNAVDNSGAVSDCLQFLSGLFGGATATDARGAWVSPSAGLVTEKVTICYAFTNFRGYFRNRSRVLGYAKKIKEKMKQEAISVEINGKLRFV